MLCFVARGQIVAKKICAAVKIVATQSTTGCHDVDCIARCLRRNTPPSPGIARSLYSITSVSYTHLTLPTNREV